MVQKHFICTHTFTSENSRRKFLTPPEYRNPPSSRLDEKGWAKASKGAYATCLQTWVGNDDFFFCHWYAIDEQAIIDRLTAAGADKFFITMATVIDAPKINVEVMQSYLKKLK